MCENSGDSFRKFVQKFTDIVIWNDILLILQEKYIITKNLLGEEFEIRKLSAVQAHLEMVPKRQSLQLMEYKKCCVGEEQRLESSEREIGKFLI